MDGPSRRSPPRTKCWCVDHPTLTALVLTPAAQLPANETACTKEIAALKDEGKALAVVYRKDDKFPDEGVVDMVEMNQLNDAELARNLKVCIASASRIERC